MEFAETSSCFALIQQALFDNRDGVIKRSKNDIRKMSVVDNIKVKPYPLDPKLQTPNPRPQARNPKM